LKAAVEEVRETAEGETPEAPAAKGPTTTAPRARRG